MNLTIVQILVVVASIQVRTLKAEVEKGSMGTGFVHGSIGPKWVGNSEYAGYSSHEREVG